MSLDKARKVLFQLSGSIACYKACNVISRLSQNNYEVEVVATHSALEFVGRATLEGLTGKRTHVEMFEPGQAMNHIDLMKWADVAVLCPATANSIAKLANGSGDDLVSALFLAHDFKKPYLIAPAMNVNMYNHPATQSNFAKLSSWGVRVLETESGRLACGDLGEGRLLDPDIIYSHIENAFNDDSSPLKGRSILVTSGGTREPLDGVRYLTNFSSGKTGAEIASQFSKAGGAVTYLHAEGAIVPTHSNLRKRTFTSFNSLESALKEELAKNSFDIVIHAAAVGDFSIDSIETEKGSIKASVDGKLESTSAIQLNLKRNPKLLSSIKSWSKNKSVKLVAFKLTNQSASPSGTEAVKKLAAESMPDLVVQNDFSEMANGKHPFRIYSTEQNTAKLLVELEGASRLSAYLSEALAHGGQA